MHAKQADHKRIFQAKSRLTMLLGGIVILAVVLSTLAVSATLSGDIDRLPLDSLAGGSGTGGDDQKPTQGGGSSGSASIWPNRLPLDLIAGGTTSGGDDQKPTHGGGSGGHSATIIETHDTQYLAYAGGPPPCPPLCR